MLPPPDARCEGVHSLFSPLPDECIEVIDTDRPHQTDTPHVVAAGHTQIESALVSFQVPCSGMNAHILFFDNAYKFGLVSHVDFQLLMVHADYVPALSRFDTPGPIGARFKFNFYEGRGAIPAITFVPWVFVPMDPATPFRTAALVFLGWELGKHFELEVNAGAMFAAKPKPPIALVLATALTCTIIGDFRIFIDAYATGYDIALGTGALWAFTKNMQIDLGTYIGLNGNEPIATPFLGFSIRR